MSALNAMHTKMQRAAAAVGGSLAAVFFCPRPARDQCDCRPPKPGLLRTIMDRFDIDPAETPFVGDAQRDLDAGAAMGLQLHLVLTGKGKSTQAGGKMPPGVSVHKDLWSFALDFLGRQI